MIFVDSSAFLAVLGKKDSNHEDAVTHWESLLEEGELLLTNNYVILESLAIIQKRYGLQFVRDFQVDVLPFIQIDWIDEERHKISIERVLYANRRRLSLVDCSAFETMRRRGIETAFTFDAHFREEGFRVIP
jgi:predicted nucleic acid-binding protein